MRLFLAMLSHETNTFSNIPTDRAQFEARHLHYGGEIVETFRGTGTCLGGMIDAAERLGVTLVPVGGGVGVARGARDPRHLRARQGRACWPTSLRRAASTASCSTCTGRWSWRVSTTARAT